MLSSSLLTDITPTVVTACGAPSDAIIHIPQDPTLISELIKEKMNADESDDESTDSALFDLGIFHEDSDHEIQTKQEETHDVYIPCSNSNLLDTQANSPALPSDCPAEHYHFSVVSAAEHSLWAHCIWNSGKALAKAILNGTIDVKGKRILELGSATGLPGMSAALMGAEMVVATDYPEECVLGPLRTNFEKNVGESMQNWKVLGYKWGADQSELRAANDGKPFDMVFQADLIFNRSEHGRLMDSVVEAAKGRAPEDGPLETYVYFSHHLVHKIKEDLVQFDIAREKGFTRTNLYTEVYPVMFEEDAALDRDEKDVEIRSTVHAIRLDYNCK